MSYKRIHVFYSGRVQGVGFRYTAQDVARGLGLNGWVKNLRDSGVELVCEGEEKELKAFLDSVKNGFLRNYIVNADVTWEESTREFHGFDIRF
ncbi:MAG: acylphosphatase [Candidatus Omnitrophica bacterium]|nr:acylphosphatase [Candidatus Omnitrophota bacterium]